MYKDTINSGFESWYLIYQDFLDHCPMPINTDPCRSMPINWHTGPWSIDQLIGIDQQWSVLSGISHWCQDFGIDQHWALIEGVLVFLSKQNAFPWTFPVWNKLQQNKLKLYPKQKLEYIFHTGVDPGGSKGLETSRVVLQKLHYIRPVPGAGHTSGGQGDDPVWKSERLHISLWAVNIFIKRVNFKWWKLVW